MAILLFIITVLINIYLSFRKKNNTLVLVISIIVLSFLAGYGKSESGDLYYYRLVYEIHPENSWEIAYIWVNDFFGNLGVSFELFHTIISAVSIILVINGLNVFTKNSHLILSLYSIVFFQFLAIAIRFSIACSIVLLGFKYLLDDDRKKNILYFVFVALGTLFHTTALFSVLFILVVFNKNIIKSLKRFLLIVNIANVLFVILMMVVPSISIYLSRIYISIASIGSDSFSEMAKNYMSQGYSRSYILYSFLYLLIYICAYNSYKSVVADEDLQIKLDKMNVICLISMIIMPALVFDRSIIRIQFWGIYICIALFGIAYELLTSKNGRVKLFRIELKPKQHLGMIYIVSSIWFSIMYISGGLGFNIFQFLNNNLLFS